MCYECVSDLSSVLEDDPAMYEECMRGREAFCDYAWLNDVLASEVHTAMTQEYLLIVELQPRGCQ